MSKSDTFGLRSRHRGLRRLRVHCCFAIGNGEFLLFRLFRLYSIFCPTLLLRARAMPVPWLPPLLPLIRGCAAQSNLPLDPNPRVRPPASSTCTSSRVASGTRPRSSPRCGPLPPRSHGTVPSVACGVTMVGHHRFNVLMWAPAATVPELSLGLVTAPKTGARASGSLPREGDRGSKSTGDEADLPLSFPA
jgi:hypothetical protein